MKNEPKQYHLTLSELMYVTMGSIIVGSIGASILWWVSVTPFK